MKYTCKFCGKDDFENIEECKKHEKRHILEEELKKLPKGAIICPKCKGEVFIEEEDVVEGKKIKVCPVCHGEKFVMPIPATIHIPISGYIK